MANPAVGTGVLVVEVIVQAVGKRLTGVLVGSVLLAGPVTPAIGATNAVAAPALRMSHDGAADFTVYNTITGRGVVPVGKAGSSAGDLTFTRGTTAMSQGGAVVGTFETSIAVTVPDNGGRERRDTTVHVTLPDGTLFAQQIQDDPTGLPPDTKQDMVVIGGTGAFRAARGVASMGPSGPGVIRIDYHLEPDVGIDPEHASVISFQRVVSAESTGRAASESNALAVSGMSGVLAPKGSKSSKGSFICGDTTFAQSKPGGVGLGSWVCRYDLARGSVLVAAFSQYRLGTRLPTTFTDIVLGGTGAYAGTRGVAVVDCISDTTAEVTLRLADETGSAPVPVPSRRERMHRSIGTIALADDTVLLSGDSASLYSRRGERKIGSSASLVTSSFEAAGFTGVRRSFGIYTFDFAGGTIRAVAYDQGSTARMDSHLTLAVTGGTGTYIGVTGSIVITDVTSHRQRVFMRLQQ